MTIRVSLLYSATPESYVDISLVVPLGSTVGDVLGIANFYEKYPEASVFAIGIFSNLVEKEALVKEGDRIEIYRPLAQDPKLARRLRAKKRK